MNRGMRVSSPLCENKYPASFSPATRMLSMAAASEYVLEPIRDSAEFTLYRARQRGNESHFW